MINLIKDSKYYQGRMPDKIKKKEYLQSLIIILFIIK